MDNNHNNISDELLAAFFDSNVNADEASQVLSSVGSDKELAEILSLSEAIDYETRKEDRRIIPMWALAAANPNNLCSLECEAFWVRARMDEGWTYGPVRDDAKKQHPDFVPYAQLPDSEKEYDRIMAMNTLRLVCRLGYDIVNRNID